MVINCTKSNLITILITFRCYNMIFHVLLKNKNPSFNGILTVHEGLENMGKESTGFEPVALFLLLYQCLEGIDLSLITILITFGGLMCLK